MRSYVKAPHNSAKWHFFNLTTLQISAPYRVSCQIVLIAPAHASMLELTRSLISATRLLLCEEDVQGNFPGPFNRLQGLADG